jgi:hypothetical protein
LRTIAAAAPGSEVVFSYRAEDCALDDAGTEFARIYTPITACNEVGQVPAITSFPNGLGEQRPAPGD